MAGITRYKIVGSPINRQLSSQPMNSVANMLYRQIFCTLGAVLEPEDKEVITTLQEFESGYDKQLGIDVELTFWTGQKATLQEKFLQTKYSTVTIEFYNDGLKKLLPGDWFNMKATYYFVGYFIPPVVSWLPYPDRFDRWVMLDWPEVQRCTARRLIPWKDKQNIPWKEQAKASFRYVEFTEIPQSCILAKDGW